MTMLTMTDNSNPVQAVSPLPTLEQAAHQREVRAADAWIDAMVQSSQRAPRVELIELDHAFGEAFLGRNTINRNLSETHAERLMRDMLNTRFHLTGDALVVSRTGKLLNGQHRCKAVVDGRVSVPVIVLFGVDDEARKFMDQGKQRSMADYLTMDGYKDANNLAAAASLLWQYQATGQFANGGKQRPTKSEIRQTIADHPGLVKSLETVPYKSATFIGNRSILIFCHYLFKMKSANPAEATNFILALCNGEKLALNSPILYLRNRLMAERGKGSARERIELIFRAWNAYRRGEHPSKLQIMGNIPVLEK